MISYEAVDCEEVDGERIDDDGGGDDDDKEACVYVYNRVNCCVRYSVLGSVHSTTVIRLGILRQLGRVPTVSI